MDRSILFMGPEHPTPQVSRARALREVGGPQHLRDTRAYPRLPRLPRVYGM